MPDDRVLNPVDVERAIIDADREVTQAVDIVSSRLSKYRDAQRAFDIAEAGAYMRSKGPVQERKFAAVLATEEERKALDLAEVEYKYAERRAKAAETRLSAYQTLSKLIMTMYNVAGYGTP